MSWWLISQRAAGSASSWSKVSASTPARRAGKRATVWLLGRGDGVAFVVLSLRFDPVITTVYMRHGAYNGLTRRDWKIFLGSVLLSNAAWTFVCFGGVEVFRRLWT